MKTEEGQEEEVATFTDVVVVRDDDAVVVRPFVVNIPKTVYSFS